MVPAHAVGFELFEPDYRRITDLSVDHGPVVTSRLTLAMMVGLFATVAVQFHRPQEIRT